MPLNPYKPPREESREAEPVEKPPSTVAVLFALAFPWLVMLIYFLALAWFYAD